MVPKESELEELKENYNRLVKKYNLPDFEELNKLFDIEESDANTDFLLRKIRRIISEKVSGYMRFVEVILNPSNAPMFLFKVIKRLDAKDREVLNKIYDSFGIFEIEFVRLDLYYSEEREAEFIKKIYSYFEEEVKRDLGNVLEKISNEESKSLENSGSSYCG
jgi:hypothetical protein